MNERKRQPSPELDISQKRPRSCNSFGASPASPSPLKSPVSEKRFCKVEIGFSEERCASSTSFESSSEGITYCSEMMRTMHELREANILCDVTICVEGKTFPAHRAILAASSPYFKALFSSSLTETDRESKPVVLTDISADCVEKLLLYIYTGEIELTKDNIKSIIAAANYLLISSLKDRCTKFLKKMLTPANCLSIESTAEQYDCGWLRTTATNYIQEHFVTISTTEEFLTLSSERLIEFVSSDDTKIDCEEQIFEAIMKWVKHDEENRQKHFKDLVSYVRFPLISPYYLMDHVESEELVRSTPDCISLLLEAKNYHMLPDRRWQLKSTRTTPRKSMGIVNGIISVGGIQGPSSSVVASTACYLLCNNRWFVLAKMQTPRCRHGLAVTGEFVYAAGGQYREGAAQSSLSHVERYDPKTNTWSSVAHMLTRRSLLNVVALEGNLYAVGGCDENNMRLNSVEKYNPSTDSWTFIPSMSACRSSPCVVADKFLYVIGGVSYVGMALNSASKYDPHTNRWHNIASMNCSRASACCGVVNGKIYVIGGWDGTTHLNSGEVYNPETDKWSFIAPASTSRWDAGVAVDGDKIFVVGGCDRNAVCTIQTECYNTETDSWSQVANLPVATHGLKCCTIQLPSKFV
ncbi:kelch-like protein 18 [Hydractinia symbiolongicarpus]|uniref:kelch-like protein 18 n=1 Tax=Hydractinia symbiolongicarpus TaxID=13093 RepID=UPI00254D883E|nr:kelch-like protein 18 [Hydractinia symbiolongicarpus]